MSTAPAPQEPTSGYTREALLDVHRRCHQSLSKLLDHTDTLAQAQLDAPLDGFAYPTVREQVHHELGAERYWVSVLQGQIRVDDDLDAHVTSADLRRLQEDVIAGTRGYLAATTDAALNEPATFKTWHEDATELIPAHVLMRTQTHLFQHQGQIVAMCRLLGSRVAGLDYPIR